MTRGPRPIRLDVVAQVHAAPAAGAALFAVGVAAALALGFAFRRELGERTRLQEALGATVEPRQRPPALETLALTTDAAAVERALRIPWTRLLAELEAAAHDGASSVSLLRVEPDAEKRRVRITAEVRTLDDALAWLERLQQCEVLRHPMLESHERRKDDPEHPLRIQLSAEWRT